jgi:general stress protein YciG
MAKARTTPRKTSSKGSMTVAEAGRKGGLTVRDERGHEFYEEIGRKGGHKVRDLIAAGKRALERGK